MAAISALMVNDDTLRREPYEKERVSAVSHAPARITSSLGNNTIRYTISNDATQHSPLDHTKAGGSNTDHTGPQIHHSASDGHSGESVADAMDIDRLHNDQDDSDNDTEQGDAGSASKKKKGQRFFCTGYPPCNLSFTRSEHLARHIRKHTGERPFQCHCNRRFSRLDNLRQHAQTVHVNEEIPTDSLAATGTRFQRQIRTDRVRPSGRPRTSTMSSTGSHSRGHSRNLSASSIGSTSSNFSTSTMSTIDPRRRPPPLLMAGDGRPKLGLEPPSTPPPQFTSYSTQSPNDITTPTSATFSMADGSPGFNASVTSPMAPGHRGGLFSAPRAPARRLSVPSGAPPQQTYMAPYPPVYGPQSGFTTSTTSTNPSAMASPTGSNFSYGPGPGFVVPPPSEEWRRRTWHPSTYSLNNNYNRPATSHLTYSQTPDAPRPTFAQNAIAAAGLAPRLPGIESFDHVQQRPTTPPRHKQSTNMKADSPPSLMPPVELEHSARKLHVHHQLPQSNTLSAARPQSGPERMENSWVQDTIDQIQQIQAHADKRQGETPHSAMGPPPNTTNSSQHGSHDNLGQPPVKNRVKRQGWYAGPLPASRTSPEDSSSSDGVPTPGTSGADVQPAIMHSNGVVEPQHAVLQVDGGNSACYITPRTLPESYTAMTNQPQQSHGHHRSGSSSELNRLDALVAVATSETNTSR